MVMISADGIIILHRWLSVPSENEERIETTTYQVVLRLNLACWFRYGGQSPPTQPTILLTPHCTLLSIFPLQSVRGRASRHRPWKIFRRRYIHSSICLRRVHA